MKHPERVVNIIGIGNEKMGDDSIGPMLIHILGKSLTFKETLSQFGIEVKFINASQDPILAGAIIAEGKPVIIVDAIEMGMAPGEFRFFTIDEIEGKYHPSAVSTHGFDLMEILKMSEILGYKDNIFILGIQISDTSLLENITPSIEEKISEIISKLYEEVKRIA